MAMDAAQDKILVEPGDVADFPLQRIDDFELGADKLLAVEAVDELEGAGAGVAP